MNHIDGVMVIISSAVDHRSLLHVCLKHGRVKPKNWYLLLFRWACSIQEIEQRLVVSEHEDFRRLSRDWLFQNMQHSGDWAKTGCFRTCRIQEIEQRLVVSEHAEFRRLSRDWLFQNMQHSGDWAETGCFRTCSIQEIEQRLVVSEHSGDWAETGCFRIICWMEWHV
jgi:hypothetical protein